MTLKTYLNLMSLSTLVCWLIFVLIIFLLNPSQAGLIGFILFYFALFLAMTGTASLVGFLIRARIGLKQIFLQVEIAFRQGLFLSALIVLSLILQGLDLLRWWNFLLLILFFISLETLFILGRE